ncbi:hypothetical protein, partial [Sagittula marina]|uniref:hypothetical protein n=1 Tax=Sagittula marina TaxID=943940 RepID=UPI001C85CDD6
SARPPDNILGMLQPRFASVSPLSASSAPSGPTRSASAPPVKGLLRLPQTTRNPFFPSAAEILEFFCKLLIFITTYDAGNPNP